MGFASVRTHPLVSIVTPSYNQGRFIEETIQSVLQQDYPNLEYFVVDGGSSDETVDILKKYDRHLTWISEKDRGQADAINKGFAMANGEIVAWLNSDDTYLPGAIRKAVEFFQAHPEVGMLYGEGYHIDEEGGIIERYYTEPFDYQRLSEICFICQPTVFMRAEVVRAIGPLDIRLDYCLDYEYWMRVAKRFRVGYVNDYLANSRLYRDTKTLSKRVEVHEETLQVVKRHYGQVPIRWINAYAHVILTERLLGTTQGLYEDGWASPLVRVTLLPEWKSGAYLLLEGVCSPQAYPLTLKISAANRTLQTTVIDGAEFSLRVFLGLAGGISQTLDATEMTLSAEKSFIPHTLITNGDSRTLSYRVRKLSIADSQGREYVLYGGRKRWAFALSFPGISFMKSLLINRRIYCKGLLQTVRYFWGDLFRIPSK